MVVMMMVMLLMVWRSAGAGWRYCRTYQQWIDRNTTRCMLFVNVLVMMLMMVVAMTVRLRLDNEESQCHDEQKLRGLEDDLCWVVE